jgi:carboxyl-terminal processing protease
LNSPENSGYKIWQPFLLAAMTAIGIMIGLKAGEKPHPPLIESVPFKDGQKYTGRVEELLRFIESKYVDSIETDTMLDAAIYAILEKLDPHSAYIPPSELEDINDQMNSNFRGIGIESVMVDDTAYIYNVLDNSPAKKAGLQPFDQIIAVGGQVVAGRKLEFSEIRSLLRKNSGAEVNIKIRRSGKEKQVKAVVGDMPVYTVNTAYTIDDSIMFIKIDRFASTTYKEFMDHVEKMFEGKQRMDMILDLRGNPGGFLPEATNILSQIFEEKGNLLVYTEGKNALKSTYESTGKRFFNIDQVAVLIDENSASASEIIAGALQDWDRGAIVGRRSYGKGLVQEQFDLRNGGAVRLTVSRYYTPSGRTLQRDYQDRIHYKNDFQDRLDSGDLFAEKSTKDVVKSNVYYTKKLNRKVTGNGGISPDIFIPADSSWLDDTFNELESYILPFILRNEAKFGFSKLKKYSDIERLKLTGSMEKAFTDQFASDMNPQVWNAYRPKMETALKNTISAINLGASATLKESNKKDAFVSKAMNYIRKNMALNNIR